LPRIGLTFHVPEPARGAEGGVDDGTGAVDGRMVVLRDAYCGLAPVPGGRVNVGIVLGGQRARSAHASGARAVVDTVLREAGLDEPPDPTDRIAGISPIGQRVRRRAGDGWLLVGDAAGFLDPFTGEGLHRALVSARFADVAISTFLGGRPAALADYDAAMRRRFAGKDVISWLAQLFLSQPIAFDYAARRLASRPALVERMGLFLGDLAPASGAVDPRFLLAILRP
jgi:flavin-dependent dehydrogenase